MHLDNVLAQWSSQRGRSRVNTDGIEPCARGPPLCALTLFAICLAFYHARHVSHFLKGDCFDGIVS